MPLGAGWRLYISSTRPGLPLFSAPPRRSHATPPYLRRRAVKNSPPDSGGAGAAKRRGWLYRFPTPRRHAPQKCRNSKGGALTGCGKTCSGGFTPPWRGKLATRAPESARDPRSGSPLRVNVTRNQRVPALGVPQQPLPLCSSAGRSRFCRRDPRRKAVAAAAALQGSGILHRAMRSVVAAALPLAAK